MKTILFACVHNAGRSQMAAAWFNHFAVSSKILAFSAGTEPGERVHLEVIAIMREVDIDLSSAQPQKLTPELANRTDMLITMGCGEACPVLPSHVERRDWPLEDPKGKDLTSVRRIRDDIKERVVELLREMTLVESNKASYS